MLLVGSVAGVRLLLRRTLRIRFDMFTYLYHLYHPTNSPTRRSLATSMIAFPTPEHPASFHMILHLLGLCYATATAPGSMRPLHSACRTTSGDCKMITRELCDPVNYIGRTSDFQQARAIVAAAEPAPSLRRVTETADPLISF